MRLYVGNLNFQTTVDELRDVFSAYGEVDDAVVISDRETGRSRGFGFVTMADADSGQAAIDALAGQELHGRTLSVNEARPRNENSGSGGGGGGGGYRRGNF